MPRNAQWIEEEDAELTKLALTNSKQNNGNLDWDQIVDAKSGQIVRRSKNAMISRWWKINKWTMTTTTTTPTAVATNLYHLTQ